MNKKDNFIIYILCRDNSTKEILQRVRKEYNLPEFQYYSDTNYFEFLNTIISECPHDFALACHDDVILPINIEKRITDTILRADSEFGRLNWGLIGNAGVDYYLSLKVEFPRNVIRYLKDPHCSIIPPNSHKPRVASHLDGNTLLINLKNVRDKKISLSSNFKGYQLYDLIFTIECYKKGLVCAVDSNLFVIHKSKGNQEDFDRAIESKTFLEYWQEDFLNHQITTMKDIKKIKANLDYLMMEDIKIEKNKKSKPRIDYYELIYNILEKIYSKKERKKIYIICRTRLESINKIIRFLDFIKIANLKYSKIIENQLVLSINKFKSQNLEKLKGIINSQYSELQITYLISEEIPKNNFPRVYALDQAVNVIPPEEDSYVWIVDDDDFIIPEAFKFIPFLLNKNYLLTGNCLVFEEKWTSEKEISYPLFSKEINIFDAFNGYKNIIGDNYIPVCSVIYPTKILKKIFREFKLEGDYLEDYFIITISQNLSDTFHIPINIAGISYHGSNTVLEKDRTNWDYSYSTFISEIVNKKIIRSTTYEIIKYEVKNLEKEINKQAQKIDKQAQKIEIQAQRLETQAQKIETQANEIEIKARELADIKSSKLWKIGEIYNNIRNIIR
jgi:hypothetical protein